MSVIVRITAIIAGILLSASLAGVASAATPAGLPTCQGSTVQDVRNEFRSIIPTTVDNGGSDFCLMSLDTFGNGVIALQDTLNHCYPGNNLVEDGKYGPLTKQALEKAQSIEHVAVDGVYGPQTLGHLAWWDAHLIGCPHYD